MAGPSLMMLMWVDPVTGEPKKRPLKTSCRIGSDSLWNDVVLTVPGVGARHAEVQALSDGGWEIVAMERSTVRAAGKIVQRARLEPGSSIEIGTVTLMLAFAGEASGPHAAASAPPPPRAGVSGVRPAARGGPSAPAPRSVPPSRIVPAPERSLASLAVAAASVLVVAGAGVFFFMRAGKTPATSTGSTASLPPASTRAAASAPLAGAATSSPQSSPAASAISGASAPSAASASSATASLPGAPFDDAKKAVVTVIAKLAFEKGFSSGTGFFVDAQGRVLTNFHVVKDTDYQQVLLAGAKKPVDARIVAHDEEHDLALLQAYVTPPVPVAPMALTAGMRMGDTVYALGSPGGSVLEVSLSRGIISSDAPRRFGDVTLLQHDASINPGNSGGPLLDQNGRVVGVNTLKLKGTTGLNFAIPIEEVRVFLDTAR